MNDTQLFKLYAEYVETSREVGCPCCCIITGTKAGFFNVEAEAAAVLPEANGHVAWRAKDWSSVETLGARMTPAILQRTGLKSRYDGAIFLDLRSCQGSPNTEQLRELMDFLAPLMKSSPTLLLANAGTAKILQETLYKWDPLCLCGDERTPTPRVIGFERREEHELS